MAAARNADDPPEWFYVICAIACVVLGIAVVTAVVVVACLPFMFAHMILGAIFG